MVLSAVADCQTHQLSLWDTLILRSAVTANCDRVLTEDLQHGSCSDRCASRTRCLIAPAGRDAT